MASSFRPHVMAVDRVERRLRQVSAALDAAGIPYAAIGGNALAAWGGRVDPGATRATKDVDLLVRREDSERFEGVIPIPPVFRACEKPSLSESASEGSDRTREIHV